VIKEVHSGGSVAYNVYGMSLISRDLDGQKAYYLYNGHGDVTALVSAAGVVIASYYYDAFGNVDEASGSFGNPYRYAGYAFDAEVRLYYLSARFYDAKIARFMQEDTYLGSKSDPLSLNLYAYCRYNPLTYWDPSGHVTQSQYEQYAKSSGISMTGAWKDTVDQMLINTGQTTKDTVTGITLFPGDSVRTDSSGVRHIVSDSGSDYGGGNSSSNSGYAGSSKPSDQQYTAIADSLGIPTGDNTPYKDIVDTLLGIGGFTSVTNLPMPIASGYNSKTTVDYNQETKQASISYTDNDGIRQTATDYQINYAGSVTNLSAYELVHSAAIVCAVSHTYSGPASSPAMTGVVQTQTNSATAVAGLTVIAAPAAIAITQNPEFIEFLKMLADVASVGGGILLGMLISQGMDDEKISEMEYALIVSNMAVLDAQIASASRALDNLGTIWDALWAEGAGEAVGKVASPGNMQRQVEKGQAPSDVDRVDAPHIPGQLPHVHFGDGTALNNDGTTSHTSRGTPNPSGKTIDWLNKNGWKVGK
jgi:RHS repeat-associated protein